MMDRTTEYAKKVVAGIIKKGKTEIQCCLRHLENLKDENFPYFFDVEEAEKAIDIANELVVVEGEERTPLTTRGFQNFIIGSLHGWKDKKTGYQRFREAYIQMARQNGKSFLSGIECNYRATFSGYRKGRIFCAATKQDQANIVWEEIQKFIETDQQLQELYKIKEHDRTITSKITGTYIKAIGRDTKSADGFRSILSICDELHAHPNNQMYKLLFDGQINVNNALTLAITTAGFNFNSFCYGHYELCKRILAGVVEKESQFIYIAEMDEDDDIWNYQNWAKANPLLLWNDDDTYNMQKVKLLSEKAVDAKEKGGDDLLNFMTKSLNVWVKNTGGNLVDLAAFKECESDLTIGDMRGKSAYLGIDLSSGGDLTSIALVFPYQEKYYVYSHSFIPELRLLEREQMDDAPYRIWEKQELLTLTSGAFGLKTDYKYIIQHLKELIEKYELSILACGYDPHNAGAFLSDLEFLGCDLVEIIQSARSLNDATVDLQLSVKAKELCYDKRNALLRWSFANAKTTSNSFGEIKVEKERGGNKIDPVDAVIDAWKLCFLNKGNNTYDVNNAIDQWMSIIGG